MISHRSFPYIFGNAKSEMRKTVIPRALLALLTLFIAATSAMGQVSVLTQHNDIGRTGQNTGETILTPTNVTSSQFGKLFSLSVDGQLYAQPLYVHNVTIGGSVHNVLIVATEADSVYAFDADSNTGGNATPLWKASMLDVAHGAGAGETPMPFSATSSSCTDLTPQIGITATPVIDAVGGTIYVEAKSTNGTNYIHRLHALDLTTGNEKPAGPTVITATVPGNGSGNHFGQITFDGLFQFSRPGLLLLNGVIYLAYASHCDLGPWHGWIFAYDAATLAQKSGLNITANGSAAGIWMSGAGIAAESTGALYMATGNGTFDGTPTELGDSIIKIGLVSGSLSVLDYFAPQDQDSLNSRDFDLGSGGVLLLPDQPGSHPHLLVQAGKEGRIYLVDRDVMTTSPPHNCSGCSDDPEIVQESTSGFLGGMWSMPAYWNSTLYWVGNRDLLKAIPVTNGLLDFGHVTSGPATSSGTYGYPGATPAISSNGNTNGIVWTIEFASSGDAVLHAYDASNVAHELYNSTQAANNRDRGGPANKFAVPTIVNGKVYVGTSSEVDVYGLLGGGTPTTATPVISPASQITVSPVTVMMTDGTSGATIFYTTDGTTPSPTNGTAYAGSFVLNASATVKAMATASGLADSAVASATYTIQAPPKIVSVTLTPSSVTGGTSSQGAVTLSANAPTAGIVVSLSSDNTPVATVPSTVTVNSGTATGTFTVNTSSVTTSSSANITASYNGSSQSGKLSVTPGSVGGGGSPVIDARAFGDGATASSTIATSAFSTLQGNELLLAFVATDAVGGAKTTVTGVSGGGLTWVLAVRTNVQSGTAEIWRAFAGTPLTNVTVTATLSQSVASSITVMSFSGVDTTGTSGSGAVGATGSGNSAGGAPTATLTTTRNNSLVYGVGNDYDNAIARTLGPSQTLVHQDLAPVGDTYWVQGRTAAIPLSGTSVTINDTAPTGDRYNLTIIEILPATIQGPPPASIGATTGTPQSAVINTAFATQLQATVRDASNAPVGGVTVTFAAPASGASGSFAGGVTTATTNASGVATAPVFTANATAGTYTVTATVSGVATAAQFSLTNSVGAPASIAATAGTPQSVAINTAFATQLQATVRDAGSNPVSGVTVTFTAPASGASGTFAGGVNTATTNASGVATAPAFTANGTAGTYTVTANVSGVATLASFSLSNTAGTPASIAATAGTPQSATINTAFATQLQATVRDAGNNPVSGVTVTFTAPASGASGTFAGGVNTASTNASGVATAPVFTANSQTGSYVVTAVISGVAGGASFNLTNNAAVASAIAIDKNILITQSSSSTTLTTASFSTTAANELLLAFVATDGAASGTNAQVSSVTFTAGSALTWTLVRRTNTARGTAEIWRAFAPTVLTNVTVRATMNQRVASGFLNVITFTGVSTAGTGGSGAIGALGSGTGTSGAPNATLVTTQNNSLVIAVGNDWDNAIARTAMTGQSIVNQYLATTGDTFWVQMFSAPVPLGTAATIRDTAPTTDQFNLSACEILPAQ